MKNISDILDDLSCDDIAPKGKRHKSAAYYIINFFRVVIFTVCLGVFVYSVNNIYTSFKDYNAGKESYEEIKNNFISAGEEGLTKPLYSVDKVTPLENFDNMLLSRGEAPVIIPNEEMEEFLKIRNKLTIMKKTIPDLYGWLTVPGTNIDYPVVMGPDNQYYVEHTAEKEPNAAGAIFVDFRCTSPTYDTKNLVIYGHNIRSWGTMFNNITYFFNENFFGTHKTIELYTFDGIYKYDVICVRETDIYSDYANVNFPGDKFTDFIKRTIEASSNSPGDVQYSADSRLITLSTCSNSYDKNNRYALVGIMTHSVTAK